MKWTHAVAAAVLALGLAACSKPKQVQPDAAPATPPADAGGVSTSGLGTDAGAAAGSAGAMDEAQKQALAALQSRNVVYFDYDSSEIKPEYDAIVTAHAGYLARYKSARVRLEGNTDERGSREYNIGLGERRAQTVRRALLLQGVQEGQITTVSYGEERPVAEGSDESAYARNRRVELVQVP
ncbi:MAG TPA: peptidoglycan-associated lipoprotein Pal [Steroidobacteraceae bacterium]|nr:peptidoglycan-associated lipoprotein Pal [Steroidobacteraceae bacterium]